MPKVMPIILRFADRPDLEVLKGSQDIFDGSANTSTTLGALPDAGVVIAGSVAIAALASHLVALACRLRRRGIIIDCRLEPIEIFEVTHFRVEPSLS